MTETNKDDFLMNLVNEILDIIDDIPEPGPGPWAGAAQLETDLYNIVVQAYNDGVHHGLIHGCDCVA